MTILPRRRLAVPEVTGLVQEWAGAPQADMWVFGGKYPARS
jgi:hypothetical protein